jgi:hypothetical protein
MNHAHLYGAQGNTKKVLTLLKQPVKQVHTQPERRHIMATTKQLDTLMKHLRTVGSISTMEAINQYRVMSLSRRICDLEGYGVKFNRVRKTHPVTGQRYVRYHLINEHNAA